MKRTATKKKLKLSVETVAIVKTSQLEQIVGGCHGPDGGVGYTVVNCLGR